MDETKIKEYIKELFNVQMIDTYAILEKIENVLSQINEEKIKTEVWTQALDSYCELLKTELESISNEALKLIGIKRKKRLIKHLRLYRSLAYQEIYVELKTNKIIKYGDLFMRGHSLSNATAGCLRGHTAFFTRVALPKDVEFENFFGGHNGFFALPKRDQTYKNEITDTHLWVWGVNTDGCLGLGNTNNQPIPVQLKLPERAVDIQTGQSINTGTQTTLMLSENGNVYGCGRNGYGELAIGNTINSSTFIKSPYLKNIKKICLSFNSGVGQVLAINEDGELFSWGYNGFGALGNGNTNNLSIPQKIILEKKIIDIHTCVWEYYGWSQMSLIITEDGSVFASGYNGQKQLGVDNTTNSNTFIPVKDFTRYTPEILKDAKKIISSGIWGTCGVLKKNGDLILWGQGEYGFGDSTTLTKLSTPKTRLRGVEDFQLVNERKWCRCIAIMKDGRVLAFGKNTGKELGFGNEEDYYKFSEILLPEGELEDIVINCFEDEGGINAIINDSFWACGNSLDYSLNCSCGTLQKQD
ncbi:RCC1 domain-containing protein [Helicobacter anatolicus]|uniref:RCC1 domain-containing protein n=1 Tax=Helicobacter anatolicus TaxID=2905874 RepID=UPI001E4BBE44|nr:hypothetical protein [Helicobacter anatolicus]MCE3040475.1 hypothetical protein [Helicobacter anatolicus]